MSIRKNIHSIIIGLLVAVPGRLSAGDELTIDNFYITAGEDKELSISLTSDVAYAAFQFDLYLPEGIALTSYAADGSRVPSGTELSMSQQADGGYRFMAVAFEKQNLLGMSGPVINIMVSAASELSSGNLTGYFRNIVLSTADATGESFAESIFPVMVVEPTVITATSYSREYGEENPVFDFTVEGAALDGEPIIECEATVSSPVGEYPIIIKKGSVKNYYDTYVNGVLTITPAPVTATAKSYTRKQGEENPDLEVEYRGWKLGETAETVISCWPLIQTDATPESEPGEYPIIVFGAEAPNYTIECINGVLTVTEADPITLTAKDYSREYGEENPTFEFTTEGAPLNGEPVITCEATKESPVGEYPIVITKGDVKNYNDHYVNGVLTITRAPLTVSVGNYEREQGEENPEFEVTYEGWKLGDDETVLLTVPTATTEATADSPAGEYAITVSGGEAENYALSYQDGVLTVKVPSGIAALLTSGQPFDVFNVQGLLVRHQVTSLKGLPRGVYIVDGQKVVVK